MILAGLWCNSEKPSMNFFLKPLIDLANELYHKGAYHTISCVSYFILGIEVVSSGHVVTVKAAIVALTCDLPARASVLNMKQFNGRNGCNFCEDEGKTADNNPLFRWWPHKDSITLRTKESMIENSIKATTDNEVVSYKCSCIQVIVFCYLVQGY